MALYDWNGNEKKDISDDFIEYQIYKDVTDEKNHSGSYGKKGISTIGAIIATVGGLFIGCGISGLLFGDEPPVVISIILWIVASALLGVWFDNTGF